MKRVTLVLLAVAALAGATLMAATLNPSQVGSSCPAGYIGTYHFVNNQTGGAAPGVLTATWDSGNVCITSPTGVNRNMQHFYCTAAGTLEGASTNLPGSLVLSDLSCGDIKEPPPCDPKKEKCD